jgi:hypothetical protein
MKYIKKYERKKIENPQIGMMYLYENEPICYLGHNNKKEFPIVALIFYSKNLVFIEWINWVKDEWKPMNMTIEDYIIDNKIIDDTLKAFDEPYFSSGGCNESLIKLKEIKNRLLDNDAIKIIYETEKYNL